MARSDRRRPTPKTRDVIVVDAGAREDVACSGTGMSMAAHAAGCAGGVLDGMCMKGALPTRERVQPPAFARGLCASARGAERAGWIDEPVICGGVIVYPGNIVLGDCDGVVIVPAARALEIVERSTPYQSRDAADREQLVPYWQGRDSERKLREIPGVEFP